MKKLLLIAVAALGTYTASAQMTVEGVTVEKSITVDGKELTLNGAGLREKFVFDLYVGGLYTTAKTSNGAALLSSDQPMAITLDIVSKLVTQDKMIEAITEGFEDSVSSAERKKLQPKIDKFIGFFNEEIVKGNEFQIAYVPGKGTMAHKNGKLLGTIEGKDFAKGLFGIWLGNKPADKDLKKGMLGL
ncbi:chalcone isomerase [Nonlabens sp. YIK11]|uniref:chalcone isomerase family protein n=1 Tax=Nonlabens sp. YIK11 TaxID=1453349 RepID=UPI0006DCBB0D|nr:chalcone isomerase family protein [Nonlabens sp. YIK11]KQC33779.1 chalcone isomerase [Nonlabens sp. YIK11]